MYQPHCQFTVYMPLAYGVTHPGIRAESENCGITMKQLDNVHFGFLDLQTSGYSTKLSSINCDKIRVRGHDTLITTNRVAAKDLLDIETTNFPVILKNTQSAKVRATTRNSSILLKGVSGGRIEAETKDAKIHSDRVVCNDLVLKTSNAKVAVEATSADLMQIVTSNSSIKGAWTIGNMLTLTTSNSKIEGTVQLKNPSIQASMFFHTSNGKISIRLPAISFRGGFDATTTHAEAQILRDSSNPLLPPVRYTVDSKNRKQGTVGEPHEHRHALMANTSNAKIAIALNGPDPLH
ncbi:hypothetical protein GGF46_000379 [Coemansia sp. RSA 552]|nr:hypothetical protein GGF46_000379 [Coemansia sp. RSA 552]